MKTFRSRDASTAMRNPIRKFMAIAVLGMASAVALAAGASATPIVAELQLRYDQLHAAFAARDRVAIAALLAPGFRAVDLDGKAQDADQMLAEVIAAAPNPERTSETTVVAVTAEAGAVAVTQRYHASWHKAGPDGASHVVDLVTLSQDRWAPRQGAWLLQETVTKSLEYSVDGKVVARKAAATPGASGT